MEYLHRDHLGSVEAVTDAVGDSLLVQAYDPFGERRKSDWMGMLSSSEQQTLADNQPLQTSRGYTGHEHLDRTGLIHMNGRLYDPQLGRFLSPDPIVAAPGSSQSWNSYSYVSNSPLSFVDPGGQFQAGVGCNVGYVMCMDGGGNTSGGGFSQGSETATIATYHTGTVYVIDWAPSTTWDPGGGGVFRHPDDRRDVHRGDIFDDPWGGSETTHYTPFATAYSYSYWSTETRQIQNPAEEHSPASKPMGAGGASYAQQGAIFPPGQEKIHHVYDFAIANNPDIKFSKSFKVRDLGGRTLGKAVPGTRIFPMVLDDRFGEELDAKEMDILLETIIHEGLHQTYSVFKNMRLGADHPEIYKEAATLTRRLKRKFRGYLKDLYE